MAVFTIGILAMHALQINATNGNAAARKRTEAVSWATNQMEILRTTPYDSLASGETTRGGYTVRWTIDDVDLDNDGANDAKDISVDVNWRDRKHQRTANLSYVRADD